MNATALSSGERDSNAIIEQLLDDRMRSIQDAVNADGLTWIGPLDDFAVEQIKDAVETVPPRRRQLAVILETPGGYISSTERIARILRHHYRRVDFYVPNYAMSAGTVLVMAGDAIHMNYASVLGPIDPQVERGDQLIPALGYLEQYQRLIDKSRNGVLSSAEITYLVERFDPAELYRYEQERELSIALLEDWLVRFKFKNWKVTETTRTKVTAKMRKERAREIARQLNKIDKWHSHGRGIPMDVLRRDLKILIDDFDEDPALSSALHDYYRLLKDYVMRRGHNFFTAHREGRYVGFGYAGF